MADLLRTVPPALLGVGCLLISGAREQQRVPPRADLATITLRTPGYTPHDTTVANDERRVAGMSHYVLREYRGGTPALPGFGIYVGYYDYQVQGKTIHSPKNCLPGAGWEQLQSNVRRFSVPGAGAVAVNRYLLANKGQQALVYYWYQGRGRVEASEYRVKWNLLRDAALYGRTEEALVRIVVPVDGHGGAAAVRGRYAQADSLAGAVAVQLVQQVAQVVPKSPSA